MSPREAENVEKLVGMADIARAQGISRERVRQKVAAGTLHLPRADFTGPRRAPLWKRKTLERAEVPGFTKEEHGTG